MNVKRAIFLLCSLVLCTDIGTGQNLKELPPGTRIRVFTERPGEQVQIGALMGTNDDTIRLGIANREMDIPLNAVTKLQASKGRKGHAKIGLLLGLIFGAAYLAVDRARCKNCEQPENIGLIELAFVGLTSGAGAGIGALIKTEQWREIQIPGVAAQIRPILISNKGIGVDLRIRFR